MCLILVIVSKRVKRPVKSISCFTEDIARSDGVIIGYRESKFDEKS